MHCDSIYDLMESDTAILFIRNVVSDHLNQIYFKTNEPLKVKIYGSISDYEQYEVLTDSIISYLKGSVKK